MFSLKYQKIKKIYGSAFLWFFTLRKFLPLFKSYTSIIILCPNSYNQFGRNEDTAFRAGLSNQCFEALNRRITLSGNFFLIAQFPDHCRFFLTQGHYMTTIGCSYSIIINEPPHQNTNNLHMRKQMRRSAVQ